MQNENTGKLYFSRCRSGKKWLWVVYKKGEYWEYDPIAFGIADTPEIAHENAQKQVGAVSFYPNEMAEHFRSKRAAIKRSQRTTNSSDTAALELVYECYDYNSEYDGSYQEEITPHRIVKKTKKRIYVERESYRENKQHDGDWRDFQTKTLLLDREIFENQGYARRTGARWWEHTFYADPAIFRSERSSNKYRPECLVGLNLPSGATAKEVQAAYRKQAATTHPDAGGSVEDFKRVQAWYEEAMQFVNATSA